MATQVPLPSVGLAGVELRNSNRTRAGGQRPWNEGRRFSRKARVPSR
jgi:hypothetical protein